MHDVCDSYVKHTAEFRDTLLLLTVPQENEILLRVSQTDLPTRLVTVRGLISRTGTTSINMLAEKF